MYLLIGAISSKLLRDFCSPSNTYTREKETAESSERDSTYFFSDRTALFFSFFLVTVKKETESWLLIS